MGAHRGLGLLTRLHIVGLLPGASLGGGRVSDLRHDTNIADAVLGDTLGKSRELAHEEIGHLCRWDDGCSAPLRRLNLAVEEDVVGRSWGLGHLMVEGDGFLRGRLVGGEHKAGHKLRAWSSTSNVGIIVAVQRSRDGCKVLWPLDVETSQKHLNLPCGQYS